MAEGQPRKRPSGGVFTAEERAAMKDLVEERRAAARRDARGARVDEEPAVLARIAELSETDRALAERVHALIRACAPTLSPRLWYGMPAYARDGKVVCFFQSAQKFKSRYATLGFTDAAHLDQDTVWPVAYAVTQLTGAEAARIEALVRRAAG